MAASDGGTRERRRSARHVVRDVKGTLHLAADAKIMNMSLTGMAVETDSPLRVGKKYSLGIRHGEGLSLRLSGVVVWCQVRSLRRGASADSKPVYAAGIQFDDALTETASDLARILRATAVIAVEKRISGRFSVDLPEPVNLNATYPFEVKTISTVGLLIETELLPPRDAVIDLDVDLHGYRLRARGRVAHTSEVTGASGATASRVGVEFLDLLQEDRKAVEAFIGHHLAGADESAD